MRVRVYPRGGLCNNFVTVGAMAPRRCPSGAGGRARDRPGGFLRNHSLAVVLAVLFLGSVGGQSYTGWKSYDSDQQSHKQETVSYTRYAVSSDFYDNVMSNWQSEFLAVGVFAVATIYLRQRGSTESKPVGAPHDYTGS